MMNQDYIIRDRYQTMAVPCPCGSSIRLITRRDTSLANVHVTHIRDSKKHYHKHCTEIYYILEGKGKMELAEEEVIAIKPGIVVMIKPGTPHRGYGDFKALIVGIPALREDDEFFIS